MKKQSPQPQHDTPTGHHRHEMVSQLFITGGDTPELFQLVEETFHQIMGFVAVLILS